jgi:ABC-2 type transport system ATP-binding protein
MTTLAFAAVTKHLADRCVLHDLTFEVRPGTVVGFVGPNGAGKTTALRILLGLAAPDGGKATVGGRPYRLLRDPATVVGATLQGQSFYPGRTARQHLRILATAVGRGEPAVDELLEQVGLSEAADRRVGEFSVGMRSRLLLAGALIGRPTALVLDEPASGLDPDGVAWLRRLLREHADRGCAVMSSSHDLLELERTADEVAVLVAGRLVAAGDVRRLTREGGTSLEELFEELTRGEGGTGG